MMTDTLPCAIMCELKSLAGDRPSSNFVRLGNRPASPKALQMRRGHFRPLSAARIPYSGEIPRFESKYEYSASIQDLIDFGLLKLGYLVEGEREPVHYGYQLTDKAIELLKPPRP